MTSKTHAPEKRRLADGSWVQSEGEAKPCCRRQVESSVVNHARVAKGMCGRTRVSDDAVS